MIVTEVACKFPDDFELGAIRARLARLPETLREIFRRAERQGIPILADGDRLAEERRRHRSAHHSAAA